MDGSPPIEHKDTLADRGSNGPSGRRKRSRRIWILLAGIVLAFVLFNPMSLMVVGVFLSMLGIRGVESKIQKPQVYEPVALRLATYCQSDQSLFPHYLGSSWLPDELNKVSRGYCEVGTNGAFVELGGGFYHFGYRLELNESKSTVISNVWELSLFREGSQSDKHLMTLALARARRFSAVELEKITSKELDLALKRGDLDAYKRKVMIKLRFGKTSDAADVCKEWIQHDPDFWLPRFTYAHVRCRLGQPELASQEFTEWVKAHNNFAHCIYLALFEFREGRTNAALAGVRMAFKQPLVEPPRSEGNKFYLGQNGALIAFLGGDYDVTLAMCDKMLAEPRQEKYWERTVLRVKAAALFMKGGQVAARPWMQQAEASVDTNMVFGIDQMIAIDKKFHAAIENNDIAFVKDPAHWVDDMEKWFSPYETDETGIHGSELNLPTPYPKTWTTDKMNPAEDK